MKNLIATAIALLSINANAMTLDCQIVNLASAEILESIHLPHFSPTDFRNEKTLEIETPYIHSSFNFLYHAETTTIDLVINSITNLENVEKTFATKLNFSRPKLLLGSTSTTSQDLNLDTLYSYCAIAL